MYFLGSAMDVAEIPPPLARNGMSVKTHTLQIKNSYDHSLVMVNPNRKSLRSEGEKRGFDESAASEGYGSSKHIIAKKAREIPAYAYKPPQRSSLLRQIKRLPMRGKKKLEVQLKWFVFA